MRLSVPDHQERLPLPILKARKGVQRVAVEGQFEPELLSGGFAGFNLGGVDTSALTGLGSLSACGEFQRCRWHQRPRGTPRALDNSIRSGSAISTRST